MPKTQLDYPAIFYRKDGKTITVKSPENVPAGTDWDDKPWPQEQEKGSRTDVSAMPPDQAVSFLRDQLSEMEQQLRNVKGDMAYQAKTFDRNWSDPGALKARLAELKSKAQSEPEPKTE